MDNKGELRNMINEVETYGRAAAKSMTDLTQAILLAGIGVTGLALDEAGIFLNRLVDRGQLAEQDARKLMEDILERSKKQATQTRTDTEQQLTEALHRMGIPSRTDVADLNAKVAVLSKKIDALAASRARKKTQKPSLPTADAQPAAPVQ